ncbi:integrase core domain-containing protein, partial [Methylobacterium oxalidis]
MRAKRRASASKLKDRCLRQEIFSSLKEAQAVIGLWQNTYNRVRPHSSLDPPPCGGPGSKLVHGRPLHHGQSGRRGRPTG